MRYSLVLLLVVFFALPAMAQVDESKNPVKYQGFVEAGVGAAYNLNTAQTVSSLNMQPLWMISTSHGVKYKGLFGGIGVGYNFTQRDKENMYIVFGDVRYSFEKCKLAPSVGAKGGLIYDPYWIEKVQKYGAITSSLEVYNNLRVGLEASVFSRPARHFTANALFVVSYSFGK